MLYLSHAYDGASKNENEEAKDHHKVLRKNKVTNLVIFNHQNFQKEMATVTSKGPPQRTVEKEGHFPLSKFSFRNGFPHKPRTCTNYFGKTTFC